MVALKRLLQSSNIISAFRRKLIDLSLMRNSVTCFRESEPYAKVLELCFNKEELGEHVNESLSMSWKQEERPCKEIRTLLIKKKTFIYLSNYIQY